MSKFQIRSFRREEISSTSKRTGSEEAFIQSFCNESPLDVEIGCGVGWHPIQYAKANPSRYLIAIEHTKTKFEKFYRRFQHHAELNNLLPVHADATRWLPQYLRESSVSNFFILYPNPEPKASSKRWIRMPFMGFLLRCLKQDGQLTIVTNEKAYCEEVLSFADNAWKMRLIHYREINLSSEPHFMPRTHFEKKYFNSGQTCYEVVLSPGKI